MLWVQSGSDVLYFEGTVKNDWRTRFSGSGNYPDFSIKGVQKFEAAKANRCSNDSQICRCSARATTASSCDSRNGGCRTCLHTQLLFVVVRDVEDSWME